MEKHAAEDSVALDQMMGSVEVLILHRNLSFANNVSTDVGEGKAAFFVRCFGFPSLNLWIDHDHWHDQVERWGFAIDCVLEIGLAISELKVDDKNLFRDADLLRRQTNAFFGVHGLDHILGQAAQVFVELSDRGAFFPEDRFAKLGDS